MRETQMEEQEQVTKCINTLDFTKDWNDWRDTLKEGIATARGMGIPDEEIKDLAFRLGDFLAEKVCPATKEEELIREMWTAADPEERKVLASIIFRTLS
jgi:sulfur relay (sulfurtransferase) DsrC/TusE family protein